jgi:predicted esterase
MTILVVFFGGFQASQSDMDKWQDSAGKQRSDVQFEAFPYPDIRKAGDKDAVNGFKQFDEVIKKIEDSHADNIYIVGHSSGCAIANQVNSLLKGDHKNITLVDLDGFAPSATKKRGQPFKPGLLREMAAGVTP